MKMCRPIAFWLPSGCGIAVTPMNVPSLMSESEAFTIAATRTSSASFTVMVSPARDLTVSVLPSTFSIVPRMRSGGGACCAHTAEVTTINESPAKPSARRVIVCITTPPWKPRTA